jgi:hypothetical protein
MNPVLLFLWGANDTKDILLGKKWAQITTLCRRENNSEVTTFRP